MMENSKLTVGDDMVVEIAYQLRLEDGQMVDEATSDEPLAFLQGHDNIISGLESELAGMNVGERREVVVAPDNAYGVYSEDDLLLVPYDAFPPDLEVSEDMLLDLHDPETDETYQARVAEMGEDGVVLDLNHPLAGETLHFTIEVISIRPATEAELAHGHVHSSVHGH